MRLNKYATSAIVMLAATAALSTGCRTSSLSYPELGDVAEMRHERTEDAVQQFEDRRDFAEYQAARSRWLQRDFVGCVARLERILDRSPDNEEAKLLLAKVLEADSRPTDLLDVANPATQLAAAPGIRIDADLVSKGARNLAPRGSRSNNRVDSALIDTSVAPSQRGIGAEHLYDRDARSTSREPVTETSVDRSDAANPLREPSPLYERLAAFSVSTFDDEAEESAPDEMTVASSRPAVEMMIPGAHSPEKPETDANPAMFENNLNDETEELAVLAQFVFDATGRGRTVAEEKNEQAAGDGQPVPAARVSAGDLMARGNEALVVDEDETAMAFFSEAMAVDPNNLQIPISAAVSALRHNKPEVAVSILGPAAGRFGQSAKLRRLLGATHYRLGDFRASEASLQEAISLDKSSALSYFLMGCTMVKLGQSEAAEMHFRQARTIDPRYTVRR